MSVAGSALMLLLSLVTVRPAEVLSDHDDAVAIAEGPGSYDKVDISVLPVVGYTVDDGAGGGVLAGAYWRKSDLLPYKYAVQGLLYVTDRQVHADGIYFDWLHINGSRLRLIAGGIFWATLDDTYCGFGNTVSCSASIANKAADERGLTGEARSNFVSTYFYRRYLNPTGEIKLRYQFLDGTPKVEAMLSWRGSGYIPGKLGALNPYPDNYYALAYPNGEPGFASVYQLGVMVDARDQESSPAKGYWADASVRVALPELGSTWRYAGVNVTYRSYVPLDFQRRWVWANRIIGDLIFGTPSVAEFSQIGCYSTVPGGLQGFGGPDIGRGIRQNRYLGRMRLMDQTEFRWTFVNFELFGQHFGITGVAFVDAAYMAVDYNDFGGDPTKIIASEGLGFRFIWDKDFIVRIDSGFSQAENYGFDVYLNINNIF